jgi:hypothetical protein
MLKGLETGPIVRHPLDIPFNHGRSDDSRGLLLECPEDAPTADGPCIFLRRSRHFRQRFGLSSGNSTSLSWSASISKLAPWKVLIFISPFSWNPGCTWPRQQQINLQITRRRIRWFLYSVRPDPFGQLEACGLFTDP